MEVEKRLMPMILRVDTSDLLFPQKKSEQHENSLIDSNYHRIDVGGFKHKSVCRGWVLNPRPLDYE